jgi:group I intron endonuclease
MANTLFTIYQITNTFNGKSYVGFTSEDPAMNRFREHRRMSRNGSKTILHCAMRKYGSKSHIWSVLEEGWDKEIGLRVREPYWISVLNPEYNMTLGGEGTLNRKCTNETREKLSKASIGNQHRLGIKHTKRTKTLLALLQTGRKNTREQRQKHSEFMKGNSYAKGARSPQFS